MVYETTYETELQHHGILGMKWGIRRFQNKDGSLTPQGKQHLKERQIRTEENLVEKTIPKGTIMYRTTPSEKDDGGNIKYVTYLDADRNLYREGSVVKSYRKNSSDDSSVYEHEYQLQTDIRIPSLKTVREIEQRIAENSKAKQEIGESYIKAFMYADRSDYAVKNMNAAFDVVKKLRTDNREQNIKVYDELCKKYGDYDGDDIYQMAKKIANGHKFIASTDFLQIEQSLGLASNVKKQVINELSKQGYNAMYDNASIGVKSDGTYSKYQEGIEPLIIFDSKKTMKETNIQEVTKNEMQKSGDEYNKWKAERDNTLRKFK